MGRSPGLSLKPRVVPGLSRSLCIHTSCQLPEELPSPHTFLLQEFNSLEIPWLWRDPSTFFELFRCSAYHCPIGSSIRVSREDSPWSSLCLHAGPHHGKFSKQVHVFTPESHCWKHFQCPRGIGLSQNNRKMNSYNSRGSCFPHNSLPQLSVPGFLWCMWALHTLWHTVSRSVNNLQ